MNTVPVVPEPNLWCFFIFLLQGMLVTKSNGCSHGLCSCCSISPFRTVPKLAGRNASCCPSSCPLCGSPSSPTSWCGWWVFPVDLICDVPQEVPWPKGNHRDRMEMSKGWNPLMPWTEIHTWLQWYLEMSEMQTGEKKTRRKTNVKVKGRIQKQKDKYQKNWGAWTGQLSLPSGDLLCYLFGFLFFFSLEPAQMYL